MLSALLCIPILLSRAEGDLLLQDSDTAVLLAALRERADPLSWFAGDWPLGNHFYRPVSTLAFELDRWAYGSAAWGFGLTNALLACLSVLLLFWFLREATDRPLFAIGATTLFALWTLDGGLALARWGPLAAGSVFGAALAVSVGRDGLRGLGVRRLAAAVVAGAAVYYVGAELEGITRLEFRIVGWLPGRTASVMTVLALLALGAYARYERLRRGGAILFDPLAPPATRSAEAPRPPSNRPGLAVIALVAVAAALAAYEQAVMLPAILTGYAMWRRMGGERPTWTVAAASWALLVGYLVLRQIVLPGETSDYQRQQFRDGPGVGLALWDYALPAAREWTVLASIIESGPAGILNPALYGTLAVVLGNIAVLVAFWQGPWRLLGAWFLIASFVAFLPMAWLKHFDHYHYWPMALRAGYVVAAATAALGLAISAASPPTLSAPRRRDPAPGSLPRP